MSSNKEIPEWIRTLRKDQIFFLETVRQPGLFGRFRYAPEGCLLPHEPISSVYAFGILRKMNAYDALETEKKQEWADYLHSFQDHEAGDFWCEEIGRLCKPNEHGLDSRYLIRRMLTRNLSGNLQHMGFPSQYPLRHLEVESFTDEAKLIAHLDSFRWDTNPWGAGSHGTMTAGMLFERVQQGEEQFRKPTRWAIEYMLEKQDPKQACGEIHPARCTSGSTALTRCSSNSVSHLGCFRNIPKESLTACSAITRTHPIK